ncbi:MAG TPA: PIG-L family deacetylase [Pyrinomonadaceae bacterium]|nr:PIG-L family deacetylase [Pyrinomonadaceae bacterium]
MRKHIRRTALALLFVSLLITTPRAQQPAPVAAKQSQEDRIALYQALLDLTNPWTVMCIAAHPDDEDGTSLIVMRRKYGAHTVSLFSTFGEGGQNAIGPELYEELGAIRARETMAAAEIQGSEPYFLGLKDFGYSKSADEAFKFWGHDEALRRMVLQIRKLRPDVIITNHSATNNDHGHHQATARLELEAFDAAADPNRFREQLKEGVTVWQVQRLFVRVRGNQNQTDNAGITVDPNEVDPIRGTTFAEQALSALQKHATQGPWPKTVAQVAARFANSSEGRLPLVRYRLAREAPNVPRLPSEAQTFLAGLQVRPPISTWLDALKIDGRPLYDFLNQPDRLFDQLVTVNREPKILPEDIQSGQKWNLIKTHLNQAVALAGGIEITLSSAKATPNSTHAISITFRNTGTHQVIVNRLKEGEPLKLSPGSSSSLRTYVRIPSAWAINLPLSQHLYDGFSSGLIVREYFRVTIGDHPSFVLSPAIELDVAPSLEFSAISPSPIVRTPADTKRVVDRSPVCGFRDLDYRVRLTSNQDSSFSGQLINGTGIGRPASFHSVTIAAHDSVDLTISVPGCALETASNKTNGPQPASISFDVSATRTAKPLTRLEVPIVWAEAHVAPNANVGYIRGFDYSLPNALNALGVESKELTVDEVKTADLQKYTSIIVDNRVYESQPSLIAANQRLLDYAKDGGTLIVFYHKSNEWNPDERRKRPQLAPYKLILGDERITDETAPITFIEPAHSLLNFPNKINQEDFANWIQERGLYYPKDWDPQYHALLQSNDPGESPLKGGLLVADYGRGHYIYTSMVWYRELRAGVPGAYRMLANMISYGQAEGKSKK